MKTLSIINNRLRWLTAGVYLGIAFIAWLESTSKNDNKKIDLTKKWDRIPSSPGTEAYEPEDRKIDIDTDMPGKWADYKHNHNKEKDNA
jgi:hypothetical protein